MKPGFGIDMGKQANEPNRTEKAMSTRDQLMTVSQVAERLNCKPSTIYAWAKAGKIPSYKVLGLLRFDHADIDELVRDSRVCVRPVIDIRGRRADSKHIDNIVKNAIASEINKGYNTPIKGKPGLNKAHKKGGK